MFKYLLLFLLLNPVVWGDIIVTPLKVSCASFTADIDAIRHMSSRVTFTVRAQDIGNSPERNFFSDPESSPILLESDDYTNSGYDRGHARPILLSSDNDVNHMANVFPQTRRLNRGTIRNLERHMFLLVENGNTIQVVIRPVWKAPKQIMPNADEDHDVPDAFHYSISYANVSEQYLLPNTPDVDTDFTRYRQ